MRKLSLAVVCLVLLPLTYAADSIPLPEHPRPDFQRADWINLNGTWSFAFDKTNTGERSNWQARGDWNQQVVVPFPWGSPLSRVGNDADIGWYSRKVTVPDSWKGRRVFLVVGASDWLTTGWLDGKPVGTNRGGYTPFEFELTPHVRFGQEQQLVLRVDDSPHRFKLEGKQGYGPARGIWQTPYLEARAETYIDSVLFTPDIDAGKAEVKLTLDKAAATDLTFRLRFKTGNLPDVVQTVPQGQQGLTAAIPVPQARLWSLSDPFLYEVSARLEPPAGAADEIASYFGMRKVSVVRLPGSGFPYIALNNRPVYLQLTLDQSYHPEGFYTFPTDEFMRDEVLRARRIGLNGLRLHVKVDVPRKIYWADRLGVLIMADVPNSWGEPDAEMRSEAETALRGMIRRDYNHPAIFSWVIFNETWGLQTGKEKKYLPETQQWVESMFKLTKSLDSSRLVEDNSPCNYDHVTTDINSWHQYLPGYRWREHLDEVTSKTFPGSEWNYIGGRKQGDQPLLNSECGNVWGYQGSTGDVDWSWDYHLMMNEFRRHPKICGWLYTEHHDVINEWNGYYRFDRSDKETGLSELVPGMSLQDLHSPYYVLADLPLCNDVKPGESVNVPLVASFMTDTEPGTRLSLRTELYGWDDLGRRRHFSQSARPVDFKPWSAETLPPLQLKLPDHPGLLILALLLEDSAGSILHRNFTTFRVSGQVDRKDSRTVSFPPSSFSSAKWSEKQWNVLDGLKVNGAGAGYFEYTVQWPGDLEMKNVDNVVFRAELSAKQLFGKDRPQGGKQEGDFMRGRGTHDPSLNPNAYPMTDEKPFPSAVKILIGGKSVGVFELPDDPADHRGILSWHSQKRDKSLKEAGSYGYLISASVPREVLAEAAKQGRITVRLEVDEALPGGLAVYGASFGRYPLDPSLIFTMK
ncbi:MAG: glycoside hydrolase family 2 [Acidobacteria bacterium]|nr:MAG: glycoside hydrolase family 2 [Acidobacteriota bacterium]